MPSCVFVIYQCFFNFVKESIFAYESPNQDWRVLQISCTKPSLAASSISGSKQLWPSRRHINGSTLQPEPPLLAIAILPYSPNHGWAISSQICSSTLCVLAMPKIQWHRRLWCNPPRQVYTAIDEQWSQSSRPQSFSCESAISVSTPDEMTRQKNYL